MEKINLPRASKMTSPNPVTVVCTQKPDGETNLATVSWWTYLSYHPSMVAFAMAKTSYSGEMVRQNKKVVITVPSEKMIDAVLGCGSTTGRNTDKIQKFGIEMQTLPDISVKVPAHSCLAIVCTLKEFIETGTTISISATWRRSMRTSRRKRSLPLTATHRSKRYKRGKGWPIDNFN